MVIEDGHVSALPGVVPGKPNLTSVTDGVLDRNRQDGEFIRPEIKVLSSGLKVKK